MKLYFYELNIGTFGKPDGISVAEVEAVEKPNTYYPADKERNFPNYTSFVKKKDEGEIAGCFKNIFLTKPNFEYAKEKFREAAEYEFKSAKRELEKAENKLKIIMESEEK